MTRRAGEIAGPVRSCVGCRGRFAQAALTRFVRTGDAWSPDVRASGRKQDGRGAYLCSAACAAKAAKNRRYPGLATAAAEYGLIRSSDERDETDDR